ncbi:MAG: FAD-dependent oxidoreductase [Anaerolineales bacterium]|jgi:ferredoxin--NADP+ reductase|nr:FAD-dependent oxidoreductase [Anaerolineales bacterium]
MEKYIVAVVGAGPAGIFAARQLASEGVQVVLFNRDIKPGGLAEYGIYHEKYKMKEGLRRQFRQALENPQILYRGNLSVGLKGDLTMSELREMGFHAILVTIGAQGTKWLGLPGEDLDGVYHAKDLVYHYNKLPPFSQREYLIGQRVALVGVGNVAIDIARWLIRDLKVDEVIAVARRGPAEVKFTRKEVESVASNLDVTALDAELERCRPIMEAVGQNVAAAREYILAGMEKALEPTSSTRLYFDFLASPSSLLGDPQGRVCGLELNDTTLIKDGVDTRSRMLGTKRVIEVDTVIYCIGDKVDELFGLPLQDNEYIKHPSPRFPIEGHSYEVFDCGIKHACEGVFVAGWARRASSGLVGLARKDGENGAQAVMQYLRGVPEFTAPEQVLSALTSRLQALDKPVITQLELKLLQAAEQQEMLQRGLEDFKFASNDAMLQAMRLA